ncbi:MAG: TlpA family protein disulfide reductase [Tannerella sp.]|jgi:peroxiredoxin|nr:TlpA family protein disulfide reductase [Tannerella sp.]
MKHLNYILVAAYGLFLFSCSGGNNAKDNREVKQASSEVVSNEAENDDRGYIVKVGDMAPDFTFTTTTGQTLKLSELRGRVVMLQFTASWCVVCRREMPFIEKDIWQKHKDNPNFALYGIDRDEPLDTVKEFAVQTGITYPMALDPGADIFALYADRRAGITRNVIVDREGRIVMLTRLYDEAEFAAMCKKIDELLS